MITAQEAFSLFLEEKQKIIGEMSDRISTIIKNCASEGLTQTTIIVSKGRSSVVIEYLKNLGYTLDHQKNSEQIPKTVEVTFSWDLS